MSGDLYGLVMCGGKSTRMGTDKSLLDYYGLPQRYYLFDLLKGFCKDVYLSCNEDQYPTIPHSFNPLPDDPEFGDIGPMAGVLTAFRMHPDASFLVVGCDYPLLERQDIEDLVNAFRHVQSTVAYYNGNEGIFEPLLTVYHNAIAMMMNLSFHLNEHSLRRLLERAGANKLIPFSPGRLVSADTLTGQEEARKRLLEGTTPKG